MIKSLPPLQDIAQMAGIELPSYLGKIVEDEPGGSLPAGGAPSGAAGENGPQT